MSDALEGHEGTVRIGGRFASSLRFADDIDGLAGKQTELKTLVKHVDSTTKAYGMEISAEKTKVTTNTNTEGAKSDNSICGQPPKTVSKLFI